MEQLLITGANGNIGRRLLAELGRDDHFAQVRLRALVRSERARSAVLDSQAGARDVEVVVGDYHDAAVMRAAAQGCQAVVHLVGIIKESASNSFASANVKTTAVLADAAAAVGVHQVVFLSIVGASASNKNTCLRSKADAEAVLNEGTFAAKILRVPMVLGEGDYASRALIARAHKSINWVLRGASLEQPIYVGDVVLAIQRLLLGSSAAVQLDLAGPESLPRFELIQRAASLLGKRTRVVSLPFGLGMSLAWVLEKLLANPPVTRAMLGVLDHDDAIDSSAAQQALDLTLTPLDEALRLCMNG